MNRTDDDFRSHARFDCSLGISEASMLAACVGAASNQGEEVLRYVESSLQQGLNKLLSSDWSLSARNNRNQLGAISLSLSSQSHSWDGEGCGDGNIWRNVRFLLKTGVATDWPRLREMLLSEIKVECIPMTVRKIAVDTLQLLVESHEKIYGNDVPSVDDKFCEFDLVDSLVAVLSVLLALHFLNTEGVSCSRLPLVEGQVWTEQGCLPMLSPLTSELMIGMPVFVCEQCDLFVTPTAVAILRTLTRSSEHLPTSSNIPLSQFKLCAQGVGITEGKSGRCLTRLLLGELPSDQLHAAAVAQPRSHSNLSTQPTSRWKNDCLVHIEANLDDISSEYLSHALEMLLKNGAVDAWVAPIVMKKGRPAHTLHCLCYSNSNNNLLPETVSTTDKLLEIIFRHTTTLGARISNVSRAALQRSQLTVQTPFVETSRRGLVDVKVGYLDGEVVSMKAEFDHCRIISDETGKALKNISEQAIRIAREQLHLD